MLSPDQIKKLEKLAKVGDIAIASELNALESKIEALEAIVPALREAKDGEQGIQGERGEQGESIVGPAGRDGIDGINGKDGRDGKDGTNGKDGRDGVDGKDGRDGKDGEMGVIDEATIAYLEDEVKKARIEKDAYDRALGIVDQRTSFLINKVNNLPSSGGVASVVAGTNVTVDNTDPRNPVVSATVEGGAAVWGGITGTLSSQTDLNSALSGKAASDHVHTGVYEPADATILKDADIGATVAAQSHTHTISQITDFPTLATVATSGDYEDLINKPTGGGLTAPQVASLISIRF